MERDQFLRRVKFILKFGKALHTVGAPAHSLEGTMQDMCLQFGIKGNIISLPTTIFSSFIYGDEEIIRYVFTNNDSPNIGAGEQVVVTFAYSREIHLAGPAYLTMKYEGSTK